MLTLLLPLLLAGKAATLLPRTTNVSSITKSLILASSPFLSPTADLGEEEAGLPGHTEVEAAAESRVHEVRVAAPRRGRAQQERHSPRWVHYTSFVSHKIDTSRPQASNCTQFVHLIFIYIRNLTVVDTSVTGSLKQTSPNTGTSLYLNHFCRNEFDFKFEEPQYFDTEPRFLKKTLEKMSRFISHSFLSGESGGPAGGLPNKSSAATAKPFSQPIDINSQFNSAWIPARPRR